MLEYKSKGVMRLIVYKDILPKLSSVGWTSPKLRKAHILSEETMQRIRTGQTITTESLNRICNILHCPIEEIIEHIPDEEQG